MDRISFNIENRKIWDYENINLLSKEISLHMGEIYKSTLKNANDKGHGLIAEKICSNMRIAESFPKYIFDINRFSVGNSHGDYNISQLIWKDE